MSEPRNTGQSRRPKRVRAATPAAKPNRPSRGVAAGGAVTRQLPPPRDPATLNRIGAILQKSSLPDPDILRMQAEIHQQMLSLSRVIDRPNFSRVSRDDVARLIRMYDERFFDGAILPVAEAEGLTFGLSSRMTRIAGKMVTQYPQGSRDGHRKFELVLSSTLLFQTFEDVDRPVMVTGRKCRDRLEAMQRVAEHEMVHLMEMLVWNDGDCTGKRFQSIARRFFAHTDFQHDLITQQERAARKFDIRVGDQVGFRHDGRTLVGRVNRITRRATVLVQDPKGQRFSDGEHYCRFYVPLEYLKKVAS